METGLNITAEEFINFVDDTMNANVYAVFNTKNKDYGGEDDILKTLRTVARDNFPGDYAINPYIAMYKAANVLVDKHNATLHKIDLSESAQDRLVDVLLYTLFKMILLRKAEDYEIRTEP